MTQNVKKLGLTSLTSIVVGSMIGAGIFNIAQNMASGASLGAIIIAWIITGFCVALLVMTFKMITDQRPDLKAGIYLYAQQIGGNYVAFNLAWGYWLSVIGSIVAYAVMLNDSLGAFFPVLLEHSWPTFVFGLICIWCMCGMMLFGIRAATLLNTTMTVVKALTLLFIIVMLFIYADMGALSIDFWGNALQLGSVTDQVRSDMLVAIWCFIGIEGAIMMSGRAKNPKDIGRAGIIGFLLTWVLYAMTSALCFGIMRQPELASLPNPSLAYVLRAACGDWAYYFIIISVIISLLGCWVAWTLLCTETPYGAASARIMPAKFMRLSDKGVPRKALFYSCVFMTVFFIIVCLSSQIYTAAVELTALMILPCYLYSNLYLIHLTRNKPELSKKRKFCMRAVGISCALIVLWILFTGGIQIVLFTAAFYVAGAWFYLKARREHAPEEGTTFRQIFSPGDRVLLLCLCLATLASAIFIATGHSPF